jgi:zinc transport system substrate-binding protein
MRNRWILTTALAVATAAAAHAAPAAHTTRAAEPTAPVQAFAGILPVAGFVERIGGARVQVRVLVGSGQSPHTFEPAPHAMADLADAAVYFSADLPFEERLLAKITAVNPALKIVHTRAGVPLRRMTAAEAEADEEHAAGAAHEPEHEPHDHAAGEPDPHFWLAPRNAKVLAAHVAEGLAAADPAHAAEYRDRLRAVQDDLDRLDADLREALAPLKGQAFFVFHPAFGYFGDAYGLRQVAVEIEGKEPGARRLGDLIQEARRLGVRVVFVQPQFSRKSAEAVARAIGGAVVEMDPLARDYAANLRDMAEKIRKALQAPDAAREPPRPQPAAPGPGPQGA